jgi:heme oxygenase-like protein
MPVLPMARGEVTEMLLERLVRPPHELPATAWAPTGTVLYDEDVQLALYLCYELHYRGLDGVDERWEWEPSLLAARRGWEDAFEAALVDLLGPVPARGPSGAEMDVGLRELVEDDGGPSLSRHLERHGTLDEVLEFVVHRSAYQLKEADPHSWAIARLSGPPKAALVEVQADEYGGGRPERVHAELFAATMRALGLDASYGAYLDDLPAITLATVNLMSLFGLHRRLRGAIVGHLAAFEMTSSVPNRRYAAALRRLGQGARATEFFEEHVEADAVHENVAAVDLAGGLARQEPALAGQVLWGARSLLALERLWADHLLTAWEAGRSSLRGPLDAALGPARGAEAHELVRAVAEGADA